MGSNTPSFMRIVCVAIELATLIMVAPIARALDPERQLSQLHHTAWTIRDGLPFAGVSAVAQTPDGFLWLASYVGGLHRFDGVQAVPVAAEQLRNRDIIILVTDTRGDLWMGFAGPPVIARLSRDGLKIFEVPTTGLKSSLLSIVPDPEDGSLWVATRDKVHHFDGQRWIVFDDPWPLTS